MQHEVSDGDLVRRAQNADEEALEILYTRHYGKLARYTSAYLFRKGCRAVKEHSPDANSEAWASVVEKLGDLRNPDSIEFWIKRISIQKADHHLTLCIPEGRAARAVDTGEGCLSEPRIEPNQRVIEASIDAERILEFASQVSPLYREILYLYLLKELDFKAIAAMLDMHVDAVRTTYYRNQKTLRAKLGLSIKPSKASRRSTKIPKLPIEQGSPDDQGGPPDALTL